VSGRIDPEQVRRFIERLHPVATKQTVGALGAHRDGVYLAPDDLDGIAACFWPGVDKGRLATFEDALIARGIPCFLIGGSASARRSLIR